ncbi:MAG: hypothetical protein JSW67_15225 [Candidatus Latescibacterota bacterium]|nr:MAG: hypothetical protein JSW67_15225 [Candidatus Latescibacterota bacterium]
MMQLDFLVRRSGLDPTAETCLHALRDLMQLPVHAVEHGTLWRFHVSAGDESVRTQLERAACRAGRYVNLNRDTCVWVEPGARAQTSACAVEVWVTQGDGRDPVALSYFRQQIGRGLTEVQSGVFYRLHVDEADPVAARRLVEDVATTRSRTHGLLANPHSQRVEILSVSPAPAEAP